MLVGTSRTSFDTPGLDVWHTLHSERRFLRSQKHSVKNIASWLAAVRIGANHE